MDEKIKKTNYNFQFLQLERCTLAPKSDARCATTDHHKIHFYANHSCNVNSIHEKLGIVYVARFLLL